MPLREPGPPPPPFDFIRFLTSSITFMAHLTEVSVFFDGKRLARIRKERGVPRLLGLRKGLKAETPKRLMRVTRVTVTREQKHRLSCLLMLTLKLVHWFSSSEYQSRGHAMGV